MFQDNLTNNFDFWTPIPLHTQISKWNNNRFGLMQFWTPWPTSNLHLLPAEKFQKKVPSPLVFRFSASKIGNGHSGTFFFLVDDKPAFSYLHTAEVNPSGSATINLRLSAGQVVQIQNIASTKIYGTAPSFGFMYSWFTGYLLYVLQ